MLQIGYSISAVGSTGARGVCHPKVRRGGRAKSRENSVLLAAFAYAWRGLRLLPLYGALKGPATFNRDASGRHAGMHPCTRRGSKDTTTDGTRIRHHLACFPGANSRTSIQIATGALV